MHTPPGTIQSIVYSIPEYGLQIGNNTPPWIKPRRLVWFVLRNGKDVRKRNGHRMFYASAEQASRGMQRLAAKIKKEEEMLISKERAEIQAEEEVQAAAHGKGWLPPAEEEHEEPEQEEEERQSPALLRRLTVAEWDALEDRTKFVDVKGNAATSAFAGFPEMVEIVCDGDQLVKEDAKFYLSPTDAPKWSQHNARHNRYTDAKKRLLAVGSLINSPRHRLMPLFPEHLPRNTTVQEAIQQEKDLWGHRRNHRNSLKTDAPPSPTALQTPDACYARLHELHCIIMPLLNEQIAVHRRLMQLSDLPVPSSSDAGCGASVQGAGKEVAQ